MVASGEAIFSPAIAQRMMHYFANMHPVLPPQVFPELTAREREILSMIAMAKSNGEIAAALGVSIKTVSNHASNLFNKLQVVDRAQAALRAHQAGFNRGDGSS